MGEGKAWYLEGVAFVFGVLEHKVHAFDERIQLIGFVDLDAEFLFKESRKLHHQ